MNENTGLPDYIFGILTETSRQFRHDIVLNAADEPYLAKKVAETLQAVALNAPIRVDAGRLFFYCNNRESPYYGIWSECPKDLLHASILELRGRPIAKRGKGEPKKVTMTAKKARAILDCLLHDADILRTGYFNSPAPGVVFQDCVVKVDFDRKQISKTSHSPSHRLRSKMGFAYGVDRGDPVEFLKILRRDFLDDVDAEEKIQLLREFIGACLLGIQTRYDCCLVFLGSGANGKSLLIEVISSLFPPEAVSTISPQDLRSEYYVAVLDGKRLNTTTEMPSSTIASSDKFKAIISGDKITARKPHCEPIEFKPQAGHIFACNTLPKVEDTSAGFWRRIVVLEFKQDLRASGMTRPELMALVDPEKPSIAAWAIQGALDLVRRGGYTSLASSEALIESWRGRGMGESVGDWATQRPTDKAIDDAGFGEVGPDAAWYRKNWSPAEKLFSDYAAWCRSNKHISVSHIEFGRILLKMGYRKVKLQEANYYNMIVGIHIPIDLAKD